MKKYEEFKLTPTGARSILLEHFHNEDANKVTGRIALFSPVDKHGGRKNAMPICKSMKAFIEIKTSLLISLCISNTPNLHLKTCAN